MAESNKIPERCPWCNSKKIETGYLQEEDEFDEELAVALGLDPDDFELMYKKHHNLFYIQEVGDCLQCNCSFTYGRRYYWNEEKGDYNLPRPLTPAERAREENLRQEKAGQQRLFD